MTSPQIRKPKEKFKIAILSAIAEFFIRIIDITYRFKRFYLSKQANDSAIYAIWHGRQYCLLGIQPRKKLKVLVSQSNDGEIIARVLHNIGFTTIRGSMGRGGVKAVREIIKALRSGNNVAFTVDGPKGPALKVKDGIIKIAQIAQRPIIPVNSTAVFKYEAKSWDKYRLPIPCSRVPLVFGEPIHIPADATEDVLEEYRLKLESALFHVDEEAESNLKIKKPNGKNINKN